MIIGTGIDIVNIERMERILTRWGDHFLRRVFTENEMRRCEKRSRPPECYAVRFAAKEAFLKAVGSGLRNGIQWTDIEIAIDAMGKPSFFFRRKAAEVSRSLRIRRSHLTLSHDHPYAVAHVLLEGTTHESGNR